MKAHDRELVDRLRFRPVDDELLADNEADLKRSIEGQASMASGICREAVYLLDGILFAFLPIVEQHPDIILLDQIPCRELRNMILRLRAGNRALSYLWRDYVALCEVQELMDPDADAEMEETDWERSLMQREIQAQSLKYGAEIYKHSRMLKEYWETWYSNEE